MSSKLLVSAVIAVVVGYYWLNYVKRGPIYESDKKLNGKTVLITGGNAGIGKATALEVAKRGARVVIASRNLEKSNKVKDEIIKESGNREVRAMQLDLGDFDSVRKFAKQFDESEKYLDYLINNAGILTVSGFAKCGVNKIFAINHFGPFLLTDLLLNKMKSQSKSRPVRIINVASEIYKMGQPTMEKMYQNVSSTFDMFAVYGESKLANIFFTQQLQEDLKDFQITTYAVHPGMIESELGDGLSPVLKTFFSIVVRPFVRNAFYGAQTTLYCVLDDDVVKYSGEYFTNCQHTELQPHAVNTTAREELWNFSLKLTGQSTK
ncbi:unnamed protein product [Clavelina lepadiformis]|uniref:Dehydrogenase with different specificities related to short-chain alcohol dehydrogenase n=1 Tax=Clavelina lepadiformis TaxID=159417 RepID=A0ABP0FXZ9_CLALP